MLVKACARGAKWLDLLQSENILSIASAKKLE